MEVERTMQKWSDARVLLAPVVQLSATSAKGDATGGGGLGGDEAATLAAEASRDGEAAAHVPAAGKPNPKPLVVFSDHATCALNLQHCKLLASCSVK